MYITNPEEIENKISMRRWIAKYFIDHNVPILSQNGDIVYFANSSLFRDCWSNAPFYIKLFMEFTP